MWAYNIVSKRVTRGDRACLAEPRFFDDAKLNSFWVKTRLALRELQLHVRYDPCVMVDDILFCASRSLLLQILP